MKRHSQQGVALIITLILLAVVTVMAVAFLASSRRERGAVTTTTDTANARLAADAALAQAEAQVMANVLATTNPYNFGLVVSTNYINSGFDSTVVGFDPTNVNYQYPNGNPVTGNDALQNIANLLYSPRAPVFIQTNSANPSAPLDFRFYLDLNRNGVDDPNGLLPTISPDPNNPYYDTNGNTMPNIINGDTKSNLDIGDPEWIGVLDHPDQPHGPNNRFIARYAFVAVPIGNALDLNAIHNQAFTKQVDTSPTDNELDGFMRNQGVGSWEINLAAFLADLNTNQWLPTIPPDNLYYAYNEPANANNRGVAFEDALSILSYRYGYSYNSLFSADNIFGTLNANAIFPNDGIDDYGDGPLQTGFQSPGDVTTPQLNDNPALSWAGSDNTNHFFDMQELFNPNESSANFTNRLLSAGNVTPTHQSTYDRYTYYRLLSQLGTDSAPEQGKMNLNYDNLDANGNVIPGAETNFISWTTEQNVDMNGTPVSGALKFFTFAADRMLRAYSQEWIDESPSNYLATYFSTNGFGMTTIPLISITNIPVYVNGTNVYSSAINRVLQLAANIYDATTNNSAGGAHDWPDVFRPTFFRDANGNVFIDGYEQIQSVSFPADFSVPPLDPPVDITSNALAINAGINTANGNVYGVPWIIGAKKGFPNFNEFSLKNVLQVTRKVEITRPTLDALLSSYQTNQQYIFNINSSLGVECWNSYGSNYVGQIQIKARDSLSLDMTNALGNSILPFPYSNQPIPNVPTNFVNWSGTLQPGLRSWQSPTKPYTNSFVIPLATNALVLANGLYFYGSSSFIPATGGYVETNIYPLPQLEMLMTNRLQVAILDGNHVIDYVQFAGPNKAFNINSAIADPNSSGDPSALYQWSTNFPNGAVSGIPYGVLDQIIVSELGPTNVPSIDIGQWDNTYAAEEISHFNAFFNSNHVYNGVSNLDSQAQTPYTPTRTLIASNLWQANDPLVHYMASDLNPLTGIQQWNIAATPPTNTFSVLNVNRDYWPWGRGALPTNMTVKDPLIYYSDDWDFPTYKLPTVGWLGRVHRGTPWQTVYMKASLPNIITWTNWTGNSNTNTFDANNYSPIQDRLLFDLFTTAPNDNATRGQLSVNVGANGTNNLQAGLAAWSALFSGVMAVSNNTAVSSSRPLSFPRPIALNNSASPINPEGAAGTNSPLGQIVSGIGGINNIRTNTALFPQQVFMHVGDIFAVTNLTEQSPFLNFSSLAQLTNGISDEMYEWLPQQVMSLLRVSGTPQSPMRYVIYCYGQTLKPAQNGIVTSGSLFGICTNYQVVAEAATRAVVQFGSTRINTITNGLINVPSVTSNNAVIESFNVLPPN